MEKSVTPVYSRGDKVAYKDRTNRLQVGKIRSIECNWFGYEKAGSEPLIVYDIAHPTYANGRHYTTDENIIGLSNS